MTNIETYLSYLTGNYDGELPLPRPIRHEIYLATICGVEHGMELPAPVTREDALLMYLAVNGLGDDLEITDARYLFYDGARTDSIDYLLSKCKNLTEAEYMFYGARDIKSVDLTNLDVSGVKDVTKMLAFSGNSSVSKIEEIKGLSDLDFSSATHLVSLFGDNTCWISNIKGEVDVSKWNVKNAITMDSMFYGLINANIVGLENFVTDKCQIFSNIFAYSNTLESMDLSTWSFASVSSSGTRSIFYKCLNLQEVTGFLSDADNAYVSLRYTFPNGTASSPSLFKRLVFSDTCQVQGLADFDLSYCSFTRQTMTELFRSLPTATHSTASYKVIKITGNPCVLDSFDVTADWGYSSYQTYERLCQAAESRYRGLDYQNAPISYSQGNTTVDGIFSDITPEMFDSGAVAVEFQANTVTVPDDIKLTDSDKQIALDKGYTLTT